MQKLLEQLLTLTNNCILPHAFDVAHYELDSVLFIWWYHKATGLLECEPASVRSHSNPKYFTAAREGDGGWSKGRIIKKNDKVYLVLYIRTFLSYKLTNQQFQDLFSKLQRYTTIDIVIDEEGCLVDI
jgi:hypothetical protein